MFEEIHIVFLLVNFKRSIKRINGSTVCMPIPVATTYWWLVKCVSALLFNVPTSHHCYLLFINTIQVHMHELYQSTLHLIYENVQWISHLHQSLDKSSCFSSPSGLNAKSDSDTSDHIHQTVSRQLRAHSIIDLYSCVPSTLIIDSIKMRPNWSSPSGPAHFVCFISRQRIRNGVIKFGRDKKELKGKWNKKRLLVLITYWWSINKEMVGKWG